jgi:hypothetical protein
MSETNNSELRLKIMDSIASTVANFMLNDKDSEVVHQENLRAAEDISEYIVNSLGIEIMDSLDNDGSIVTTIKKETPEEFDIRNVV